MSIHHMICCDNAGCNARATIASPVVPPNWSTVLGVRPGEHPHESFMQSMMESIGSLGGGMSDDSRKIREILSTYLAKLHEDAEPVPTVGHLCPKCNQALASVQMSDDV